MHIQIATAIVLSLAFASQPRGWVSSVTGEVDVNLGAVQFTVRGNNPCGAVNLDFGDGTTAVTHAISQMPVTLPHGYTRVGEYTVRARGMGNCDGDVFTRVHIPRVRPQWMDRNPTPTPAMRYEWTDAEFHRLDRNRDNYLSGTEWRYEPDDFLQVDRNRDDRVSLNEFLAGDDTVVRGGRGRGRGWARGRGQGDRDQGDQDPSVTVAVTNRVAWTDTGLDVRAGDVLNIDATGRIQFSRQPGDTAGPNGAPGHRATAQAPMPNMAIGALLARVGNSAPFFAGTNRNGLLAPQTGRLYLGINDDNLRDNGGEFRATVSIDRGRGR